MYCSIIDKLLSTKPGVDLENVIRLLFGGAILAAQRREQGLMVVVVRISSTGH